MKDAPEPQAFSGLLPLSSLTIFYGHLTYLQPPRAICHIFMFKYCSLFLTLPSISVYLVNMSCFYLILNAISF